MSCVTFQTVAFDDSPKSSAQASGFAGKGDPLDAYSSAVVAAVESVGPAVVGVRPPEGHRGGSGSGFFITPDGYALTNSHVVHGRERLTILTADGDRLDARLVGDDPSTDLAVLRATASDLPYATLGESSSMRVGQLVIAIGSPLGFEASVSTGIVSGLGRSLRGVDGRLIDHVIQHTSPLNPGNSGGPLADWRGNVIAVNTAIIAMAQGIGFGVPADTARWVAAELISRGAVRRAHIGVAGQTRPLDRRLVRRLGLLNDYAVWVAEVPAGGPAARAGIEPGDFIVSIQGRLIQGIDDLHRFLARWPSGEPVQLGVVRGDMTLSVSVAPTFSA